MDILEKSFQYLFLFLLLLSGTLCNWKSNFYFGFFNDADSEMSYDHLAAGLKDVLMNDKSAFDADRLQKYTGENAPHLVGIFQCFV